MFVICYCKIIDDKKAGIQPSGIYFGGIAETKQEAECIARSCVNEIKGGTIVPKIFEKSNLQLLTEIKPIITSRFEKLFESMYAAEEIMRHNT